MGIIGIANLVGHELHHLIFYGVALSILRDLFHIAAMLTILLVLLLVGRTCPILIFRQQTVYHQVGITTDGRGEVGVIVEGEAIVTDIMDTVLGLHHRPEGNGLDGILLTCALGIGHQGIERFRDGSLGAAGLHPIAELRHELSQVLQFLRIRLVVDTIRQRLGLCALLHPSDALSDGLVGQQHKFLDEFVGILRHLEVGCHRLSLLIDVEVELFTVELHGAVLEAGCAQLLGEGVKLDEFGSILALVRMVLGGRGSRLARTVLHPIVLQDLLHLLVSIATIAPYHGMCQVPLLDVGISIEQEYDTVTQFLLVRSQRTDEVTEAFGQHRYGAVYEIDARSAAVRLLVDGRSFPDVVAHIGDMDTYLPEIIYLSDREGIVEVLGILGVDGAGKHIAEILTPADLLLSDGSIDFLSSFLHILRILIGQVVLGQDGMHLGIVVARLSEDINYGANDILMVCIRPLDDLYHCLVIGLASLQLTLGDDDVVNERLVLRYQHGEIFLHTELTHYLVVGTADDLDHHRLLDMLVATGHIRHLHLVAVHRRHRVTLCHKDGCTAVGRQERVAPVGLATEGALLQLRLRVQAIAAVADLQQEVVPCHLLHHVDGEHLQRMGVELQSLEYLFEREGLIRIVLEEVLEQFTNLLLT